MDTVENTNALLERMQQLERENELLRRELANIKSENTESSDKLREVNALLDTILDNLPLYLFVKDVDNDFRYLYWNKAFAEYSKIPASRVIGNTDFDIFPEYKDALKFRNDDIEVTKQQEPLSYHETYVAADGKSRICQTLKVLHPREGHGPLLIGVSMDITNMENIEQELVQERLRAEQSDRLKSRFLANMSHEIRTPLNAIVGFANLLTKTEDRATRERFVNVINQNTDTLLQLISDILDLSKIEAGTLEYTRNPMGLNEMLRNIHDMQKDTMPSAVNLIYDNAADQREIILQEDRNRLMQVVNNLINNAAKFTPKGEIRFGYEVGDDTIRVYVKDTGAGIPSNKLNTVFDRFVKLDNYAQGTGLGLSICQMIVNIIGGKIWVDSEEGKGSTFQFTIPYTHKQQDKKNAQIENNSYAGIMQGLNNTVNEPLQSSEENVKKTILIAEDVPSNTMLLEALLGDRFNLLYAIDGMEAVKQYKQHRPDLIFMDIRMPNLDGLEATRIIRTYSKSIPIIALTAYAYDSDRQKAFEVGVDDYLTKPVRQAAVNAVLDKFLQ